MGFNGEVSSYGTDKIEAPNPPFTVHFSYQRRDGFIKIDRISASNISEVANPVEANVGQFGLFALCHAGAFPDKIVEASIRFQVNGFFGNVTTNNEEYGDGVRFEASEGQNVVDIFRDLKLHTLLRDTHQDLHDLDANCPLLNEVNNTDNLIKIILVIHFKAVTATGKVIDNRIRLLLTKFKFDNNN